jgi:polyphosphate kinase
MSDARWDASEDRPTTAGKMGRKDYEQQLALLQAELVRVQEWVVREGTKVLIVFEGRDGAGGGSSPLFGF